MYLGGGAPPYGSSMFNGPPMPRYGIPQFPGSSAYPYGYGGRIPMGSPYGPMQMAGPPPYSGGSMMGAGNIASGYDMHAIFLYFPMNLVIELLICTICCFQSFYANPSVNSWILQNTGHNFFSLSFLLP